MNYGEQKHKNSQKKQVVFRTFIHTYIHVSKENTSEKEKRTEFFVFGPEAMTEGRKKRARRKDSGKKRRLFLSTAKRKRKKTRKEAILFFGAEAIRHTRSRATKLQEGDSRKKAFLFCVGPEAMSVENEADKKAQGKRKKVMQNKTAKEGKLFLSNICINQ